ncbi:ComEC/Rec2 family competence protein [Helicovermis profundi]|uniref:DNA internalization-related competence protein ComEC/Rec2 n=1 Tax=Helicovermis profundi TaxID=3065157 RepID=A0AAU9E4Z1_9FIRM|nr:DNA internalization-related competence protein ComEC/Rec2 [Clostridia bacterium S502]
MFTKRCLTDISLITIFLDFILINSVNLYLVLMSMYCIILFIFFVKKYNFIKEKKIVLLIILFIFFLLLISHSYYEYRKEILSNVGKNLQVVFYYEDPINKKNAIFKTINNNDFYLNGIRLNSNVSKLKEQISDGEVVEISFFFTDVKKIRNIGEFDYEKYLQGKGLFGSIDIKNIKRTGEKKNIYLYRKNILTYITEKYKKVGPNFSYIASSLVFGIKTPLENEKMVTNSFVKTSTIHFLTVSGFHFGILYIFLLKLFRKIKIPFIIRNLAILIIISSYWFLTAMKFSAFRALCTIIIIILAKSFYKKFDFLSGVSLVIIISIILNTLILQSLSFVLTVLACIGIGIIYPVLKEILLNKDSFSKKIITSLLLSFSIQFSMLPYNIIYNNNISFISLIYMLIFGIIISILFYISFFAIFISNELLIILSPFLDGICKTLINFNIKTAKLDLLYYSLGVFKILTIAIFIIVALVYLKQNLDYYKKIKIINLSLIILFISVVLSYQMQNSLLIYFIDVGEGDSSLIITPSRKTILIDSGNGYLRINSVLKALKVNKIDYLVISHEHMDHIGGAIELENEIEIKNILYSKGNRIKNYLHNTKSNYFELNGENTIYVDGVKLDFQTSAINLLKNINNNSLILKVTFKDLNILFTGDMELEEEKLLLNKKIIASIDILKSPHHGSKTSSSEYILNKINPKIVVIQVGKNSYSHPSKVVINRYNNMKLKIYRNDKLGMIRLKYKNDFVSIKSMLK